LRNILVGLPILNKAVLIHSQSWPACPSHDCRGSPRKTWAPATRRAMMPRRCFDLVATRSDHDSVCICTRSSNRTLVSRTTATYAEFTGITVMSDLSLPGCLCIPFVYRSATKHWLTPATVQSRLQAAAHPAIASAEGRGAQLPWGKAFGSRREARGSFASKGALRGPDFLAKAHCKANVPSLCSDPSGV
jgi:hypothetical protein